MKELLEEIKNTASPEKKRRWYAEELLEDSRTVIEFLTKDYGCDKSEVLKAYARLSQKWQDYEGADNE